MGLAPLLVGLPVGVDWIGVGGSEVRGEGEPRGECRGLGVEPREGELHAERGVDCAPGEETEV